MLSIESILESAIICSWDKKIEKNIFIVSAQSQNYENFYYETLQPYTVTTRKYSYYSVVL